MNYQLIWDLEGAIGPAIWALFDTQFMAAVSQEDSPLFQKPRARVEIMVQKGPGNKHLAMVEQSGLLVAVEDSWALNLRLDLITPADPKVHGLYRAFVRYQMAQLPALINGELDATGAARPAGTFLANHWLGGPMESVGDSPMMKSEDGLYQTVFNYKSTVKIHADAWAK